MTTESNVTSKGNLWLFGLVLIKQSKIQIYYKLNDLGLKVIMVDETSPRLSGSSASFHNS